MRKLSAHTQRRPGEFYRRSLELQADIALKEGNEAKFKRISARMETPHPSSPAVAEGAARPENRPPHNFESLANGTRGE